MGSRLAVDIGGTFTDVVLLGEDGDLRTAKVATTPDDPSRGVLAGIGQLLPEGLSGLEAFVHGTTIVLNALLERRGAVTGLITTKGFRDVLEIMRTNRPDLYDLQQEKPPPLVPRPLRLEVNERLDSKGRELRPLDRREVKAVARTLVERGAESIAICFLFSFLNPAHERAAQEAIAEEFPDLPVSISADVAREWREFERTSTVVINSYCRPLMGDYVATLRHGLAERGLAGDALFMQSNGGLLGAQVVRLLPVKTILSGPVGGVIAAELIGRLTGTRQILTLDIGGTSADMCLIDGGRATLAPEKRIEGWPVLFAAVDVTAIGAGGGSIAYLDRALALNVGPRSAGSVPGPVCYGRGGEEPTVTDAHLALGCIDPDYFLGGELKLDAEAARTAIRRCIADPLGLSVEQAAAGIIQIVNAKMLQALREVALNRGYDVRDFTLLPFGGAGGLHATALARELDCAGVIVPVNPGVFSAVGMLAADLKYDVARTCPQPIGSADAASLAAVFAEMEEEARRQLPAPEGSSVIIRRSADLRYRGQEYTLNVEATDDLAPSGLARRFEAAHRQSYGYTIRDEIWLVGLRSLVTVAVEPLALRPVGAGRAAGREGKRPVFLPDEGRWREIPIYDRGGLPAGASINGPAIVEERQATTLLQDGDVATVDEYGNLLIALGGRGDG